MPRPHGIADLVDGQQRAAHVQPERIPHLGPASRGPRTMKRRRSAGITLIEVLIAVSLLSLLAVGMLAAILLGFDAQQKTNARLMENRRIAGAQRILEQ